MNDKEYQEMDETLTKTTVDLKRVQEKFAKLQENPALEGAENDLFVQELDSLNVLLRKCGEIISRESLRLPFASSWVPQEGYDGKIA